MKKAKGCNSYFFVDESGDPVFYDAKGNLIVGQAGCSPILILGFIETQDPHPLRQAVLNLHNQVLNDEYLQHIPSFHKTAVAFHAKDDSPEVRYLVYKLIKQLNFKAQFIVARKIERVFRNSHKAKENHFYDNLVSKLFQNALHRYQHNHIFFSTRGSRARRKPLNNAIWRAKGRFDTRYKPGAEATTFEIEPQSPKGEPCLSLIDYLNWALYRAYTKKEMRYYDSVSDKVSFIRDLYDFEAGPNNFYHRKKPFDISRAAPLELGL